MSSTSKDILLPANASERGVEDGSRTGLIYGFTAYSIWGFMPLYFHALANVEPWRILCHRIFWSAIFLGLVVSARKEWARIWPILRSRRSLLLLSAGAVLIALNWLLFIYAVASRQVLQASLGYFINPLLSIALGMFFLGERLRGWQWLAVFIAIGAVANLALRGTGFPWIATSLACSFGFYGLVRKKLDINSLHGLLVETAVLLPLSVATLALLPTGKTALTDWVLLSLTGVTTAIPLLMFGVALRRLNLATIGFLQYIGPTLQFLVAICVFREPVDRAKLVSFGLCWLGIAVYVADSILNRRPPAVADEPE
jgi:chloramphenicol-sensitive protein RarD